MADRLRRVFTACRLFSYLLIAITVLITFPKFSGAANQFSLAWDANGDSSIAGYRLYARQSNEAYNYDSPSWEGPDTSCTVDDLIDTAEYCFVVRCYDINGIESGDSNEVCATAASSNQPPVADAGPDQNVESGLMVSLSGENSIDLDDGIASYHWEQINGLPVDLSFDPVEPYASFVAPEAGGDGESLTFELTVTDYEGLQSVDSCIVNVSWINTPPFPDAGPDQTVNEGMTVVLDGSGSADADDGIVSHRWAQVGGVPVSLSDPMAVRPSFTAPDVGPDGTSLRFQLTVTDNGGLQAADTCIVNVSWVNRAPVSDAGADQTVDAGATVSLDGSQSADPDDGIARYSWKQITGLPVTLSDPTGIQPDFTAPAELTETESLEFELNVTDFGGLQSADHCMVSVTPVAKPDDPATVHVADLEASSDRSSWFSWKAAVEIRVHDAGCNAVDGATVSGTWSGGSNGSASCVTRDGVCSVTSSSMWYWYDQTEFTVTDISFPEATYLPAQNHDADMDSDGSSITVYNP